MFVDVHAFKLDRLSIEQQDCVRFTVTGDLVDRLDLDAAETNVIRNDFRHLTVFFYCHQQFVKIGVFGVPGSYIVQVFLKRGCLDTVGTYP